MIEQAERYFSFPTVLPLDPTSALLLVDSAEAAMSDVDVDGSDEMYCETIVKRMLKKVEGEPKRVVAVIMRNRRSGERCEGKGDGESRRRSCLCRIPIP